MDRREVRVLVVDEHAGWRSGLCRFIGEQFGLTVEQVANAEEARHFLAANQPRVVLLDLNLTGGAGLPLASRIRLWRPEATIIVLSDYDWPEYRLAAQQAGATAFVAKERLLAELPAALGAALNWAADVHQPLSLPRRLELLPRPTVPQLAAIAGELGLSDQIARLRERQLTVGLFAANFWAVNVLLLIARLPHGMP